MLWGQVGRADLGFRPSQSDGPDSRLHPLLLLREDMVDDGAHLGAGTVGALVRPGIGRSLCVLKWIMEWRPALRIAVSLAADRWAVSAQTALAKASGRETRSAARRHGRLHR